MLRAQKMSDTGPHKQRLNVDNTIQLGTAFSFELGRLTSTA
jgi:hypothetical protein